MFTEIKYVLDQNNLVRTGYDCGFEQGIREGIEQGSKKQLVEIAKEMKRKNYTNEEIEKITKLSKEEIEKL